MKKTLLVGNGLNRCYEEFAWEKLLIQLANDRHLKDIEVNGSFPLEFERIMNLYIRNSNLKNKSKAYTSAKKRVIKLINKLENISYMPLFEKIKTIDVDNIMTTNYDLNLEKIYSSDLQGNCVHNEVVMCSHPTDVYEKIKFYHIHGTITKASTICLSYRHYINIIKRIEKEMLSRRNGVSKCCVNERILRLLSGEYIDDSWWYLLFNSNVYILGLGLGESEVDLWWLLSMRAAYYYQDYYGAHSLINNKIIYYDVVLKEEYMKYEEMENVKSLIKNNEFEIDLLKKSSVHNEDRIKTIKEINKVLEEKLKILTAINKFDIGKYNHLLSLHVCVIIILIESKNEYERAYDWILDNLENDNLGDSDLKIRYYEI